MNINVDLQCVTAKGTGIAEFAKARIDYLSKQADVLLYGYYSKLKYNDEDKYLKSFPFPVKTGHWPISLFYSRKLAKPLPLYYDFLSGNKADINLYFTWNIKRVRHHGLTIATIHDLIALRTEMESPLIVESQINDLTYTLQNCDYILTVSETSKKDIIMEFNYPHERIKVIPNGIDFKHFNKPISEEKKKYIRTKYGLPENYILYLGGIRKHKNIERLIEAYSILSSSIKDKYHLVITKGNENLKKLSRKLNIEDKVLFTQFIDEEDKVGLYQMADLYAYVSLYEGFGIPVIEAQASGTPVITSNVSSLPEIAGDSAMCVNPVSVKDIAYGIDKILSNNTFRYGLINKGFDNSARYSNENAGAILYEFLKTL